MDRSPSPTPTADYSIISRSHATQYSPLKTLFPRIWDSLTGSWLRPPDQRLMFQDYSMLPPLDGDEGELIDDEACFIDSRSPPGFDILSHLPPELALHVLCLLFQSEFVSSECHSESLHTLFACLSVSRTWRSLALDNSIWKAAFHSRWGPVLPSPYPPTLSTPSPSRSSTLPLFEFPSPTSSLRRSRKSTRPSPFSSRSSSPVHHYNAPLSFNWKSLYCQRLQLERRWSNRSFEPKILPIDAHADSVYCLEFDQASSIIITGSRDRTIKLWSLKSGRLLGTLSGAHQGSVLCLKFEIQSPESQSLDPTAPRRVFMVSGSSDASICIWDLELHPAAFGYDRSLRSVTGKVRMALKGHGGGVLDLRIDSKWIVSCSKDGSVRVWDRKTYQCVRTLLGHEGPVNAVGFQGDEGRIVSASGDGKMILWDLQSGSRLRTFEGHDRGLACIEFKGDLIISGSNDCKIKIWSVTGECVRTLVGHESLVRALSFDPRTGLLVSASYDRTIKIWDVRTGKMLREFRNSHSSHIFDVKFDCRRILSTSHDQKLVIHDFSLGLETAPFFL